MNIKLALFISGAGLGVVLSSISSLLSAWQIIFFAVGMVLLVFPHLFIQSKSDMENKKSNRS